MPVLGHAPRRSGQRRFPRPDQGRQVDFAGLVQVAVGPRHLVGWVCAGEDGSLIGFVNVVWDGGVHAFILDTVVAPHRRARGIGAALIATAAHEARTAKCEWLHVDFEEHLRSFYFDACGFKETTAGLIAL